MKRNYGNCYSIRPTPKFSRRYRNSRYLRRGYSSSAGRSSYIGTCSTSPLWHIVYHGTRTGGWKKCRK